MSMLPCKNPSCKSNGQPHPNCRCYGGMADGGEAGFCSANRPHDPGCQYFYDGGQPIDQNSVTPDAHAVDIPQEGITADAHVIEGAAPIDQGSVIPDSSTENENLSPEELQEKMLKKAHPNGPGKYESLGQQALGAAESFAQNATLGLSTALETKVLGVPEKDIKGRAEQNPIESAVFGTAGAALGPGKAVEAMKLGSTALKMALTNGLVQGGDEVSKWILGEGDPADPVGAILGRIGISTGLGFIFGKGADAAGATSRKLLQSLSESKMGERGAALLQGIASIIKAPEAGPGMLSQASKSEGGSGELLRGVMSEPYEAWQNSARGFKEGQKLGRFISGKLAPIGGAVAGGTAGAIHGWNRDGLVGALSEGAEGSLEGLATAVVGKAILGNKVSQKYVAPAVVKALTSGSVSNIGSAIDHAANIAAGSKFMNNIVSETFKASGQGAQQAVDLLSQDKKRKKIIEELEGGAFQQSLEDEKVLQHKIMGYAQGGQVSPATREEQTGIAQHYPEQNMLLAAAKGRVFKYLNGIRPEKNGPHLPFDKAPDDRERTKAFHKAVDIAVSPLSVMNHVQKGTLEAEQVAHFKAMYPEVNGLLQKKLMEGIIKSQMDKKAPSYKVRQSLSLLMGVPLSSDMTPAGIQSAQAVFAQKGAPPAAPSAQGSPQRPGTKSALSKSDRAYLTDDQARMARQQKT